VGCIATYFHEIYRKPSLACDLPQCRNFEPKSAAVITSLWTPHPASFSIQVLRISQQHKTVDKLKMTRPFVEVKNVISSQHNKSTVHVSASPRQ
jgi:hypothetical protein